MAYMRIPGQANILDQLMDNDLLVLFILAGILLLILLAVVFLFLKLVQSIRHSGEGKTENRRNPKKKSVKSPKKTGI